MTITRNEPIARLVHSEAAAQWANSDVRIPVFTLTRPNPERVGKLDAGDDIPETIDEVFTMPAKPNPGLALEYLRMARKQGEVAMSWLIETAVGEQGYDALVEDLGSVEDPLATLRAIVTRIQTVAMGGLDGPKA